MGKKNKKVCLDLLDLGVRKTLWLKPHPSKRSETIMPIVPWVMAKEEQIGFLNIMANLKLPSGYPFSIGFATMSTT